MHKYSIDSGLLEICTNLKDTDHFMIFEQYAWKRRLRLKLQEE